MIVVTFQLAKFTFPMIAFCSTLRIGPYLFYKEKFISQFKTTEKMIGYHTRLRKNDDLPLWRGSAVKKKPPFFNALSFFCLLLCERSAKGDMYGIYYYITTEFD